MSENWKKVISALLLAATLCVLPGTMAWASDTGDGGGSTNIGAITPDAPIGDQNVGENGGAGSGGSGEAGNTADSGNSDSQTGGTTDPVTTEPGTTTDQNGSGASTVIVTGDGGGVSVPDPAPTDSTSPAPETTPSPEPSVTPTPTATPAPTPPLPVITKHPTDETVNAGGECWFIANYTNALYAVWHFVSPDGKTDYRYDDPQVKTAFPGLKIENGDYSALHLSSIPAEMNGWGAYCEYRNNNGSTKTSAAVVRVNGAPAATPAPSPSATPAATPSPTPTPSATAAPTPAPSPEVTSIPMSTPTPEETAPPAALNHGGRIFLLFGAAALAVGALAIGAILLVSNRASKKEAYSYRSTSRRKK